VAQGPPRAPVGQRRGVPQKQAPPAVTEAQFQSQVLHLARLYGWLPYHTYDSRRSHPGWPDLVLLRPPRLLFIELKAERGRLRPEQRRWLGDLAACGHEVAVFRPDDLQRIPGYLKDPGLRLPGPEHL
jgi:hypothetical protein